MRIIALFFLAVTGSIIGSFVGALTWRVHKKMNFVSDRSECEHCHHKLAPTDLLPIISWLCLKGRCRYCRKKIGSLSLWLEISVAIVFVASYIFWPLGQVEASALQAVTFALWLVAVTLMAALFVYDLRWGFLPNKFMLPLAIVAALISILNNIFIHEIPLQNYMIDTLLAMIPVAGIYGAIYILSNKKWIGGGDVKFGIIVGLLLSWQGALAVLFISNVLGSLVMLPLLLAKKVRIESQIPFGPFLIFATFAIFLIHPQVLNFIDTYLLLG